MQPLPPPQAQTVVTKRGANHGLHLVLTLCTCGIWAITGWPIAAIMGRRSTTTVYPQAPQGYYPPQQQVPPPGYPYPYPPQPGQPGQQPPPYGQPPQQ
jgi:hypothetical protein